MLFNRRVRSNFNRESLYCLFLLVRAVRVVRGSWFSTGVSVVILTAKCAKTANKKKECPQEDGPLRCCGLVSVECWGVSEDQSEAGMGFWNGVSAVTHVSLFVPFASFAVHVSKTACPLSFSPRKLLWSAFPCSYRSRCSRFKKFKVSVRCNFHRETRENREQKRECPLYFPWHWKSGGHLRRYLYACSLWEWRSSCPVERGRLEAFGSVRLTWLRCWWCSRPPAIHPIHFEESQMDTLTDALIMVTKHWTC